jgi:hypothetical protein
MKCNFCKTEMLEGYIPTPAIEWVPKYVNKKLKYIGSKTNGFRIGRMHLMSLKKQSAWYCPNCDLIIISCK